MMKNKKTYLVCGRNKFKLELKICNKVERFFGLMFMKRKKAEALLFNFKKSTTLTIHSFFVFFPFLALWLDDKNRIIDLKMIKPFTFSIKPTVPFYRIIEIPFNKKYNNLVKLVVGNSKDLNIEFA